MEDNLPAKPQGPIPEAIRLFAEHYELPVTGVTNMGGKPYVNAGGLMYKAKQIGLKSIKIDVEKAATKEDLTSIVKATVILKDNSQYEDYGYGSKESIKMSTLHNADFVTMTTITRAKNRALRSATGFGLVSVEEMVVADNMYSNDRGTVEVEGSKLAALKAPQETQAEEPEVVEVKLGELKKKEEPAPNPTTPNSFYDDGPQTPTEKTMEAAQEVFGEPKAAEPATAVAAPPKLTAREKKEKTFLEVMEKNPTYDTKKMFKMFEALDSNGNECIAMLTDSRLDICIDAVRKNKPF